MPRIKISDEERRARQRDRAARPHRVAKKNAYEAARRIKRQTPEGRAADLEKTRKWLSNPENHAKMIAYKAARRAIPENKAKQKLEDAARYATPRGRAMDLLAAAKWRTAKSGMDFNLAIEDIEPSITFGYCARTGQKFDMIPLGNRKRKPNAPSIDRIDSSKGYIKGNIQIVTWAYNTAKHDRSDEDLFRLAELIIASHAISVGEDA